MANFKVIYDVNSRIDEIEIRSDTEWMCSVIGNFTLSKYSGSGNDKIHISAPIEFPTISGTVIFSYDDERCDMPSIDVFFPNKCFIETDPPMGSNGFITLYQHRDNEAVVLSTYNLGGWRINEIDGDNPLVVYNDENAQDFVLFADLRPKEPLNPDCDICMIITSLEHDDCAPIPIIIKKC